MVHYLPVAHYSKIFSNLKTWLNQYLPHKETSSPVVNARLASRISNIQEALGTIKPTMDARFQLISLGRHNGKYCTTCGPYPARAYCSLTCPLRNSRGWLHNTDGWARSVELDVWLYQQLAYDVDLHGPRVTKQMVQEWEVAVIDLFIRTVDSSDCGKTGRLVEDHPGFDESWTFSGHWGQGVGLEVDVGPEQFGTSVAEGENSNAEEKDEHAVKGGD